MTLTVEGKVIVDADVSRADQKIKALGNGSNTIGNGKPIPGEEEAAASEKRNPHASYFENLAQRGYHSVLSNREQARTPAQVRELADKAAAALYNATQSGNKELVNKLTDLTNQLRATQEEMERARRDGHQPPPPTPPQGGSGSPPPPASPLNNIGQWFAQQGGSALQQKLTSFLGGPLGGAIFGGAGRFLTGPIGIGLGVASAANYAFNAVSNAVTEKNSMARDEIMGYADLARQYNSSRDFMGYFRDANGWTNNRFARLGFTATQAARVAAQYDRPGGMMNDTEDILRFSRTTGTNESRTAQIAQQFGRAGVAGTKGGNADDSLRTLKLAMQEGVKAGIAQSETLNSLSSTVQRNSAQGQTTNATALAYFASVQQRTNASTNMLLRGESGMNTMKGFMEGLGNGGNDQGIEFLLIKKLIDKGLPSAQKAGMTGDEAKGYEQLLKASPIEAARYLMQRAGSGKNPQLMAQMSEVIDQASGGNAYLKKMLYKQINPSASDEEIVSMIGGGGLSSFIGNKSNGKVTGGANSKEIETYKQGLSLLDDVQGNNKINNQTMWLRVAEQDRDMLKSIANLNLTAGLEGVLAGFKNEFANWRMMFSKMLGGPITEGGDLRGRVGSSWKNPSSVRPTMAAAIEPDTTGSTATPISAGGTAGSSSKPTGFVRTASAVAQVESGNGRASNMNAPGRSAMGLFQIQSQWLPGKNGWAREAGIEMKNPNGSPVTTTAQARAWQLAHPDQADKIALYRLKRIEEGIRGQFHKQGAQNVSEAHIAGLVSAVWHQNGGGSLDAMNLPITDKRNPLHPFIYKGELADKASEISNVDAGDGVTHRQQYDKAVKAYNDPNLQPAAIRGQRSTSAGSKQATRIAAKDESVVFTQGFGENKGNKQYGYGNAGHLGWDFRIGKAGVGGEAVHSRTDGKVVQAGPNRRWGGNTVIVERNDGYRVLHGHLQKVSVKAGQQVSTSTVIGTEGNSGGFKGMSPHLHIEVYDPKGYVVNPAVLFGNNSMKLWHQVKGFRRGGYTGDHGIDEIAGVVHGQEYVMTAEATRRFRPMLERMNKGESSSQTVNVNLSGMHLNVAISPPAQTQLQHEYDRFQRSATQIITQDLKNDRGIV